MNKDLDSDLWASIISGDIKAYSELYKMYAEIMYRYGLHLTSNIVELEDCIHDVFVNIFSNHKKLPLVSSVKAYLFVSLRNAIYTNKNSKKILFSLTTIEDLLQDHAATIDDVIIKREEAVSNRELISELESNLSEKEREAIYFRFVEGMSYKEVAEVMRVQTQSAQNYTQRAIEKMRLKLSLSFITVIIISLSNYKSLC